MDWLPVEICLDHFTYYIGCTLTESAQLSPSRLHRFHTAVAFGITDVGLVRRSNQDNFLIDEALGLVMVGDGMGGHYGGEIASSEALTAVRDFITQNIVRLDDRDLTVPSALTFEPAPEAATTSTDTDATWTNQNMPAAMVVFDAIEHANRRILRNNLALDLPDGGGMGTTLTGFWHVPGQASLVVFHVGDTRLYRYRDSKLAILTRDQTPYQQAIENGEVANLPNRNLLLQAIGPSASVTPDVNAVPLLAGDLLMLCSDGLHGSVPHAEIENLMALVDDCALEDGCTRFIAVAKDYGSRDNITVVLVRYGR